MATSKIPDVGSSNYKILTAIHEETTTFHLNNVVMFIGETNNNYQLIYVSGTAINVLAGTLDQVTISRPDNDQLVVNNPRTWNLKIPVVYLA